MSRIIVIAGPTASGKTGLAVELALRLSGEVVSADSMQIYRGMNIGTAKPDMAERRGIPHHMLDVVEPGEDYSVSRYVEEATVCVDDILSRRKTPIICGGTGLYIDSLLRGGGFRESGIDSGLRAQLENEWSADPDRLTEELRRVDPETAARLHPNDRRRILRALEIYRQTGMTITAHNAYTQSLPSRYDALCLALDFADRATLYARIDRRVDRMLAQGLIDEVCSLRERGMLKGTAAQAIGYKELIEYFDNRCSLAETAALIRQKSRNYAKRQLTWFRRDREMHWIIRPNENEDFLLQKATDYLKEYGL